MGSPNSPCVNAIQYVVLLCSLAQVYSSWDLGLGVVTTPEVTTNVCNMSLSSDAEKEGGKPVQCRCDSTEADCSELDIRELPSLISFTNNVKVANFRGNELTDICDDTFYSGKEIIELNLSNNKITFLSVVSFPAFKKLQKLILSHNSLWHLHPDLFSSLTELKYLDVSFNDINFLQQDTFKDLGSLRELKLEANPIHELEPGIFEHLNNLEVLDLEAVMLKELPELVFSHTPNLRILSLSNNLLDKVPTDVLKVLKKLKVLNLSGNLFQVVGPHSFRGLESLNILYLDRIPGLKAIEDFAFGDLAFLRELHCSYNFALSYVDKNAFVSDETGNKTTVGQLFLRQNNLESLSPKLLRWNRFVELHLRGNPWECDCRSQWLLDVETKNEFRNHVRCAKPAELRGRTLTEIQDMELYCAVSVSEVVVIVCAVAVCVFLCLLAAAIVLHRRNFRRHLPYFQIRKLKSINDVEYDQGYAL